MVATDIPDELTDPIKVQPRPVRELADVGLVLTDHVEAVERANIDRAAVRCIEDAAKNALEPLSDAQIAECLTEHPNPTRKENL